MKRISSDDVRHVARLAELEFSDGEVSKTTPQLDKILEHVARVSAVDTDGILPTSHAVDIKNVFREDTPEDSISQQDALKNAPEEGDEGFRVPRID
ncbi:MAG: Asp-tRNA(Asn)/Glu-tRNA(Gln) amidotransferase subunit GatC [Actinomycetia bacterium]|nr:Asp-tRNA(Asn)/Glu-tRNA(Gln) amidotransferase subunit GatC [Actinomycetes bacterium]